MMETTNLTGIETQAKTFRELLCSPALGGALKQLAIFSSAVNILLSITAFFGNSLILVALHKESSLHPPSKLLYRCLATTDLLTGLLAHPLVASLWISVVHEHWSICRFVLDASLVTSYVLHSVSLMTTTAISVDRLLALLLGLRYKQIVNLKRIYVALALFWVVPCIDTLFFVFVPTIPPWLGPILIPSCLVISVASYIKIFRTLSRHQAQVQDHVQQQSSQPNALNMARCKKAMYSALWVQLALVVCYVPLSIVVLVITHTKTYSPLLMVIREIAITFAYLNSTLNPFLYCWKIHEVRRAVKQIIRQVMCCPWI